MKSFSILLLVSAVLSAERVVEKQNGPNAEDGFLVDIHYENNRTISVSVVSRCSEPVLLEYYRVGGIRGVLYLKDGDQIAMGRAILGPPSYCLLRPAPGPKASSAVTKIKCTLTEPVALDALKAAEVSIRFIRLSDFNRADRMNGVEDFMNLRRTWSSQPLIVRPVDKK